MVKSKNTAAILIAFFGYILLSIGRALLIPYYNALPLIPFFFTNAALWWIALAPVLFLMRRDKTSLRNLGVTKEKAWFQILLGLAAAILLAAAFGVLNARMGQGNPSIPQVLLDLLFNIVGVGFVEEMIFRGYIFKKLLDGKNSRAFAIVVSSVLFGLSHLMNLLYNDLGGTLIQVALTTALGLIFCLLRERVKRFNMLALIILHAAYDSVLPFFTALFRSI